MYYAHVISTSSSGNNPFTTSSPLAFDGSTEVLVLSMNFKALELTLTQTDRNVSSPKIL